VLRRECARTGAEQGIEGVLHAEGFKGLLIFLVAAGIFVPLFHRARIGTVLGFLLIGLALGPHGLGQLVPAYPWLNYVTFDHPERAEVLAELGIIFLLFLLGLELSIERLWQLRRYVFGFGLFQVVVTTFAIGAIVRFSGLPPPAGIVLGMCLALSSTAIVMQILTEQHRAAAPVGRTALSVLLFQDLMVVPILFIVGILSGGRDGAVEALTWAFGQAVAAVLIIMLLGRYIVRPLLTSAAHTGSRELLMAITLLIVVGTSAATAAAGLSAALGAFLAGLLLSETEYRHQIEVDIDPFKGLLLGIFFVTVGTSIDLSVVVRHALAIAAALFILLAVKTAVLYVGARLFAVPRTRAIEVALLLAQAGEFAFVVLGLARRNELLPNDLITSAIAVAGLSMMVTPLLGLLARRLAERLEEDDHAALGLGPEPEARKLEHHVVIGGFGRVGQTVARILEGENVPFVVLDTNGHRVAEHRDAGRPIYYGDASRAELLKLAGARRARAFVVTLDGMQAAERMVEEVLKLRPKAKVFARARDAVHAKRLSELGAVGAVPEAIEASFILAARLMKELDISEDAIARRIAAARMEHVIESEAQTEAEDPAGTEQAAAPAR
jgi:CPA2 family monovalent cation:H+ antiporter-2